MITRDDQFQKELLTSSEIAKLLNITLNTVHSRNWQTRSGCPLIKIGKRIYSPNFRFWKWVSERSMIINGKNN